MFEHLLTVSDQMFGEQHWVQCVVFTKQVEQSLLSLDLRATTEIGVTPEKLESIVDQPILPACC